MLFNKKQLHSIVQDELEMLEDWEDIIEDSIQLIKEYMNQDYYESKNKRIDLLIIN